MTACWKVYAKHRFSTCFGSRPFVRTKHFATPWGLASALYIARAIKRGASWRDRAAHEARPPVLSALGEHPCQRLACPATSHPSLGEVARATAPRGRAAVPRLSARQAARNRARPTRTPRPGSAARLLLSSMPTAASPRLGVSVASTGGRALIGSPCSMRVCRYTRASGCRGDRSWPAFGRGRPSPSVEVQARRAWRLPA